MHDSFIHKLRRLAVGAGLGLLALAATAKTPNIVMIMTDDVAPMDISAIHRGIGAVNTPNIDRLAKEGLMISDFYAQPSCTAGRDVTPTSLTVAMASMKSTMPTPAPERGS